MPEIKIKGSIPVFSARRSSAANSSLETYQQSSIPTFNAGASKPRQRSLPRSVALSANSGDDKSAILNKYVNFNGNNNTPSHTINPNYNCSSLNRRKTNLNDQNNNVLVSGKNVNQISLNTGPNNEIKNLNCLNFENNNGKSTLKSTSTKSKLIRPSTSVAKQKKDVDKNNNVNNFHANMLIMNNKNLNKNSNNNETNTKIIETKSKIQMNSCKTEATTKNNDSKANHQFQLRPNFNFKDNIYNPNNNKNSNLDHINNNKDPNKKVTTNMQNKTNDNHRRDNNLINDIQKSNLSVNSNIENSKLKPPRNVSSMRPTGLLKPKNHRSSRQTSPDTTNRSLEDVLGDKSITKHNSGKKQYKSSERILSSEKINDFLQKETINKPLRVNSIGRNTKNIIKYSKNTDNMKKLMNEVEKNFKTSTLSNEHHSRISGSSNDGSVTSSEEKASSEYIGNFDNRVRNKGISKSYSKLMVPGFSMKNQKIDQSKILKYHSKSNIQASLQQNTLDKTKYPKSNSQQLKCSSAKINQNNLLSNVMSYKNNSETTAVNDAIESNEDNFVRLNIKDNHSENGISSQSSAKISSESEASPVDENKISNELLMHHPTKTDDGNIHSKTKDAIESGVSAYDIQPMAPISMSAPYFHLNTLTSTPGNKNNYSSPFYTKTSSTPKQMTQDLLKLKSSFHRLNMTSLDPTNADENNSEAGYMSDGDLLSCKGHQRSSGYVSDGGNSLLSFEKYKRNSNNPSVEEESDVKRNVKNGRCYADTNSSIYEENFDALSSLSSNEDSQDNNIQNPLTTSVSEYSFKNNKENVIRRPPKTPIPVKSKKAILPLCGFVKRTQENEELMKNDNESDNDVLLENKISTKKFNLPSLQSTNKQSEDATMANEGMAELESLKLDYKVENTGLPPFHPFHHKQHVSSAPNFSDSDQLKMIISNKAALHNQSILSNFPTCDSKPPQNIGSANSDATGGWKEGTTGSKFGMSLEQCYNSGVFQRRNSSNAYSNNLTSNFLTLSDISQTDKPPLNIKSWPYNFGNNQNNNLINNDIIRKNLKHPNEHNEKTLSVASDGDQGYGKPSTKSNPYATMSRSQMASRLAKRLESHKEDDDKSYIRSCYATPTTNRKSDISNYYPDDTSSIASYPSLKIKSPKISSGTYMQTEHSFNLDDSCYSGVGGSVTSGNGGHYMLHRSGSYKMRNSRPPSTNENGSTLSLGSCSSLYSTVEEHHAQEIRKLRHELETAHSRVASLNMQLNINENVVHAFEQSISNLNQRLLYLTSANPQCNKTDSIDGKSCLDAIDPYKSNTQDSCSISSLSHHQEMERKKKQKKWSFGKSLFKKKNKMNIYDQNIVIEMNPNTDDMNSIKSRHNSISNNIVIRNTRQGKEDTEDTENKKTAYEPQDNDSIEALEQKLYEKELKLTDVQLEALSSAHQLDQLKDNMAQMEKEMLHLKMDNSRLKQQLVKKGETVDENDENVLSSPSEFPKTLNDDFTNPDFKNTSHKRITLSVQFKHTTHCNSLAFSEIKSKEILFGKMHLSENIGWETLNRTIAKKFENYLEKVDPEERIGLSQKSIKHLRAGELCWSFGGPQPRMGPSSYFIGFNNSVSITLKGVNENCLDALAFETMISKNILERYVKLLLDFKRVIFCGPSGTGKTYLALKLAQYMYDRLSKERKEPSLSVFNVDHKSSKELRQYLSNITRNCINNGDQETAEEKKTVKNDDKIVEENEKDVNSNETGEEKSLKKDITEILKTKDDVNQCSNKKNLMITNITPHDHSLHNNIIVLDNLHHVVSLADVFNGFVTIGNNNSPYVIGTMNQVSSTSATNLQLHHMFRWVLYSNHIKPVNGFLGRFLRRHMVEREVLGCESRDQTVDSVEEQIEDRSENEEELKATIEWMPKVWQYVNKLLEAHNSSEVTLGPQLYLSCPMGGKLMRVWFTDLWNYSIFPYIVEALKDGIQTYGCRAPWEDPTNWLEKTCPWKQQEDNSMQLLHLRPEDVGYDLPQQKQYYQNFQQTSPHVNGSIKLSNSNITAFQVNSFDNEIDDFTNESNLEQQYIENIFSKEKNPESIMNMLMKIKEAKT